MNIPGQSPKPTAPDTRPNHQADDEQPEAGKHQKFTRVIHSNELVNGGQFFKTFLDEGGVLDA